MIPVVWGAVPIATLASVFLARWTSREGHRRADDLPRLNPAGSWWTVAIATVLAVAAVLWLQPAIAVPSVVLIVAGTAISWIDIDVHRIPNRFLAGWVPVQAVALAWSAWLVSDPWRVAHALFGAALLGGLFLVLATIGTMGMGDFKLAGVCGAVLGFVGWPWVVLSGLFFAVLGGAIIGVVMLRRVGRHGHVPYGPAIVAGSVLAVALSTV